MDRQDTQPVLSEEDYSYLMQHGNSLATDMMTGLQEPCSLFEEMPQSPEKSNGNDDKLLQQQQIQQFQHQQMVQQQQHPQDQFQQSQQLLLSSTQTRQKNIKISHPFAVATMKRENNDATGISLLTSDSLSSTPPEMLKGIPYSAVHTISSDTVNGSKAHQYSAASCSSASSSSSQACYNQTNAYSNNSYMPSTSYCPSYYAATMPNQASANIGTYNSSQIQPMQQQLHQVSQGNKNLPGMFQSNSDALAVVSARSQGNPVSGCTTLRLQNQVEVYQNIPQNQVQALTTYPNNNNNINNYNTNNNLTNNIQNSYTTPQTQYSCSDQQLYSNIPFNNINHTGSTSNCNSSKFPEPFSSLGPYSPATIETTDVIATLDLDNTSLPQQAEQQQQLVPLHDIQEKKFVVPRDQKFLLPGPSNELVLRGTGLDDSLDDLDGLIGLARASTIDVTTLDDWAGDYNFKIKVVPHDKHKNKWCYSSKVHRLYCYPMLSAEVQVSVNDWARAAYQNAEVRIVAVYQDSQNRIKPVQRCHHCKKSDSGELIEHLVQVSNSGAVHSSIGSRYTVSVPLVRSHQGVDSVTLLIRCTCMSSCVGGPNRRPFALLFSLMMNGEEKGRQVLSTKCCKGPNRDIKKDEADHDKLQAVVSLHCNLPPLDPDTDGSPKKPNLAIAGSSGLNLDGLAFPLSTAVKRKPGGKKLLVPTDLFSSDSESERSSNKKSKLANGTGGVRTTLTVPEGYAPIMVPSDLKSDVVKYVEGLLALKYVRSNKVNVLKGVDLT